jgi:hypothetical protein
MTGLTVLHLGALFRSGLYGTQEQGDRYADEQRKSQTEDTHGRGATVEVGKPAVEGCKNGEKEPDDHASYGEYRGSNLARGNAVDVVLEYRRGNAAREIEQSQGGNGPRALNEAEEQEHRGDGDRGKPDGACRHQAGFELVGEERGDSNEQV